MTLQGLIYDEYSTELCSENQNENNLIEMAQSVFSDEQMEEFIGEWLSSKKYIFTQGFLRGIAANMAGAI